MPSVRRDNSAWTEKAAIRRMIAEDLPRGARILEGFSGSGKMWRAAWMRFGGLTIDKDLAKAELAAEQRATWRVCCGDTLVLLAQGIGRHEAFNVVDLDCWGSPWSFVEAWFVSARKRAPLTKLVLTDGYMARMGMASADKSLVPGHEGRISFGSQQGYLAQVDRRLDEWASAAKLKACRVYSEGRAIGKMATHVVDVRQS